MPAAPAANMPPPDPARGSATAVLPLVFLLGLAASCAAPERSADPRAEREAVLSAIDRLWDAYSLKDIETQKILYAEDAVQIGDHRADGRRAILRYLDQWYRGREIQSWTHSQRDVKLVGDVALASYWDDETGLVDGVPYRVSCWVSDVWVRRDGTWHNLLSHFGANQALEPELEP